MPVEAGNRNHSHPFIGSLINGYDAAGWLASAIGNGSSEFSICSAYLRSEALKHILAECAHRPSGRVLVRWQLADLISGASDLHAYQVAKDAGLQLLIRLDFHGKVFAVPDQGILVGSANATLSGLSLRPNSNEEVCTLVPSSPENLAHIDQLIAGAVTVDDRLFSELYEAVQIATLTSRSTVSTVWPDALLSRLQVLLPVDRLLFSECLQSVPKPHSSAAFEVENEGDRQLLGLTLSSVTVDFAAERLQQTRIFRWLLQSLERAGGQLYFGTLTEALHESLLEDPIIYRSDVKVLLQFLLAWCEALPTAGICVDRPYHSQRVRLRDPSKCVEASASNFSQRGRGTNEALAYQGLDGRRRTRRNPRY